MRKISIILALIILSVTVPAFAGPNWISGNLTNYTTIQGGLLIMVDAGIPGNCAGTPYGWILIAEADKAMTAMAFMRISQGKWALNVYTDSAFHLGFCRAVQFDPVD
jgi:hypothetical protein